MSSKINLVDVENKLKQISKRMQLCNFSDYNNTYISLGFFTNTHLRKENEELVLSVEEYNLIRQFRKLPAEDKKMYLNFFKEINRLSNSDCGRKESISQNRIENTCNPNAIKSRHFYGYCYIGVDSNWSNHYKIGKTFDPTCKSRASRSINPNYKILYRTKDFYQDAGAIEYEIHQMFKDKNINANGCSEWFELSAEELETLIKKYDFVEMETLLTSSNK